MSKLEDLKSKHKLSSTSIMKDTIKLRSLSNDIKKEEINNDFSIHVNKCFVVDIDDTLDYIG